MLAKLVKGVFLLAIILIVGYGIYVALREQPILVDLSTVKSAPMKVTIDEEGVTQVSDVYIVSAAIAGHLDRINLEEGDIVSKGQIIASVHPLDPPFLDDRTRAEVLAAIEAARGGVIMAEVEHQRTITAMELTKSDYERAKKLVATNTVSQTTVDRAYSELQLHIAQAESALASIEVRKAELASAEARLMQPGTDASSPTDPGCCANIISPVDGVVLSVLARSEQAVATGTQIAQIGDLREIEVKVDLLSSDAVRVTQGASVEISDWGGAELLAATVRRIEPAAFTKISALGIEEQRVNIILNLESSSPQGLGHGYRVLARLTIWETESALQVPISALFRSSGSWSVFSANDGRADLRKVEIGQMNTRNAQILSGLKPGEEVVMFPSDQLETGRLIESRADSN